MITNNLIYNKPTECGPSYFVTAKNGDSDVNANNTGNPECMTDNDPNVPGTLHAIVTPNNKLDERPENLDKSAFYVTKRRVFNSQELCYRRNK